MIRGADAPLIRTLGWSMLAVLAVFLLNDFFTYWLGWPGAFQATNRLSLVQTVLYPAAVIAAIAHVFLRRDRTLRDEARQVYDVSSFVTRAAFWSVLLIGLIDMSISFLRSEELLFSKDFNLILGKSAIRGAYIHMPLIALSVLLAAITRTIGVIWLSLFIVVAELLIVMSRFVFSYEQDYMADLVRFWYAALFLFGCAYTLREEGHVRVDVLYAGLKPKTKGLINAAGALVLGIPFCWLILIIGLSGKTGVLNSSLLRFEIEGLGDGMHTLYLMTVFMGIFAISMLIEFIGFLFDSVADYKGEPGGRDHDAHVIQ